MATYTWLMFGNDDFGLASGELSNAGGTFVAGTAGQVVTITDNDLILDDDANSAPQVEDASEQYLQIAYDGHGVNSYIDAYGSYTVTNTTTGESGMAYLIWFNTGNFAGARTDTREGQFYRAFTIAVHPGDTVVLGVRDPVGHVPYANLYVCFTAGTLIRTPGGDVPIDGLEVGDLVDTLDHGPQPIRWIGSRNVAAVGNAAPVVVQAGALGNTRDLRVSPQHRILLANWRAELLFGEAEVLVPAKLLVNHDTIFRREGGEVEYFHIMFDQHEIVFAEGIPSESFHPGPVGLATLESEARQELLALFPELATVPRPLARPVLRMSEASLLA